MNRLDSQPPDTFDRDSIAKKKAVTRAGKKAD
jgi:hypothetical protein